MSQSTADFSRSFRTLSQLLGVAHVEKLAEMCRNAVILDGIAARLGDAPESQESLGEEAREPRLAMDAIATSLGLRYWEWRERSDGPAGQSPFVIGRDSSELLELPLAKDLAEIDETLRVQFSRDPRVFLPFGKGEAEIFQRILAAVDRISQFNPELLLGISREEIENFIRHANESAQSIPRVLVVNRGGVADALQDFGVLVHYADMDNLEEAPDSVEPLPASFLALAVRNSLEYPVHVDRWSLDEAFLPAADHRHLFADNEATAETYASLIAESLGKRAKVLTTREGDMARNSASGVHAFAMVDRQWIVDAFAPQPDVNAMGRVLDLTDPRDQEAIRVLYGPELDWQRYSKVETAKQSVASIEP